MRISAHLWNSSKSVTKVLVLTTSAQVAPAAVRHRSRFWNVCSIWRPHVAFADTVAVDVAGQLAGGIDDLAAAAHRHGMGVGRLSARHSDVHAFRLKPLDLEDHSALLSGSALIRPALAHKTTRRDSGSVARFRVQATIWHRQSCRSLRASDRVARRAKVKARFWSGQKMGQGRPLAANTPRSGDLSQISDRTDRP
jgi:hypothetical protein